MKRKSTFWIALAMILPVAFFVKTGFSKSSDKDKKKDKPIRKMSAYIVSTNTLINEIAVSGSLLAFDEVELKNEVSGRVVFLHLPEGKPVKKGTLLVKLFDEDLLATLHKLEAQLVVKRQIFKRQSELLKVNGVSQNEYDQTGLELKTLQADIEAQKAAIRKTEVRAPFDGVIGLKNVSQGAVVSSSSLLATIRTSDKIKLDFSIPERYSSLISHGMKVDFTLSNGDEHLSAVVYATERGIETTTRSLKVRALVTSKSSALVPGAFANVTLRLGENKNAILVPTDAIIPQEDRKTLVVARKGKAHMTEVKTGIRQNSSIEITEGLQVGDTVIINGIQFLKEDAPLSYSSVTKKL